MGLFKNHCLLRKGIQMRRLNDGVAQKTKATVQVIGDKEQNIDLVMRR